MKALPAKEAIWWVGALDFDIRVFDIVMYTDYGTTYNSYLVKGKDKTVLFETVKEKFFDEHLERIREVCDPADIDYIVVSHTEPDHTGSLEKMLALAPKAVVLCSSSANAFLKEILNKPFPVRVVTEKDAVDLGGLTLKFFTVPMLHWPDSMFTYIPESKALFTCDSFGCHYCSEKVFNDLIEGDFYDAYRYYFDNIMGPYKFPHMVNALAKIKNLQIDFIGNGHGPVLRTDVQKYIDMYSKWSLPAPQEKKSVAICYVSAYGYTKQIADKIAEGIRATGISDVKLFDLVTGDKAAAKEAILESTGFLLGSPTMVGDALPPVYEMLIGLNPIVHKGKFAAAFGSFGWSGEAVPNLMARLAQLKFTAPAEGLRIKLKPSETQLESARLYGEAFGKMILDEAEPVSAPVKETKKWRCVICGQVFDGEAPPAVCPVCGADASHFEEAADEKADALSDTEEKFVIIGGGIAAKEAAGAIRLRNKTAGITMICAESVVPYNRPALSDYVAGTAREAALPIADEDWYRERAIELLLSERADRVDPSGKTVHTASGRTLPYDKLLIATGAGPFIPVEGAAGRENVCALRTLADAKKILSKLPQVKAAVIVGGGILGLEAADALVCNGVSVTVVEPSGYPMTAQLDEVAGKLLESALTANGVYVRTGSRLAEITDRGAVLENGETLDADLILFCSGVRAELSLAKNAGLETDRGIKTNSLLETSVRDIYAAGDCAQQGSAPVTIWPAALAQGKAAGANMAGDMVVLPRLLPSTMFEAFGLSIFSAGSVREDAETKSMTLREDAKGVYKKLVFKNGKLCGGLLFGDTKNSLKLLRAVENGLDQSAASSIL